MKELQSELKLRKKVSNIQRPRQYYKEEDSKKKPVTTEELEKIKRFDKLLDQILAQIDPFNLEGFEIADFKLKDRSNKKAQEIDCQDLFKEFILDPQKQKKSNSYSGFFECKKKFDLIQNKEDPEQQILLSERFDLYNSMIPITNSTKDKIEFLRNLPQTSTALDRKKLFQESQKFQKSLPFPSIQPSKHLTEQIFSKDQPPDNTLDSSEKLLLLRSISKHLGDWEKIEKEFKEKPVPVELLKKIWRCLKVTMKEEVAEIKKKAPQFHYIKWLRAAVRKLELGNGKKVKNKQVSSLNMKPREQRLDMLAVMAETENSKSFGIESSTFLNCTASSSFKVYENDENI